MKTVKQIVTEYLKANGYDGLYSEENECGCPLVDLGICDSWFGDCEPGYKIKCNPETCFADGDCDFHIGPTKEVPDGAR